MHISCCIKIHALVIRLDQIVHLIRQMQKGCKSPNLNFTGDEKNVSLAGPLGLTEIFIGSIVKASKTLPGIHIKFDLAPSNRPPAPQNKLYLCPDNVPKKKIPKRASFAFGFQTKFFYTHTEFLFSTHYFESLGALRTKIFCRISGLCSAKICSQTVKINLRSEIVMGLKFSSSPPSVKNQFLGRNFRFFTSLRRFLKLKNQSFPPKIDQKLAKHNQIIDVICMNKVVS